MANIEEIYSEIIYKSRYARWLDSENRRETWNETVKRYCDFFSNIHKDTFPYDIVYDAIYNKEVMPSMRALMTAGKALERDNIAGYNCAYVAVDSPKVFSEILYILLCGTGVGFSVERQYINELPEIPDELHDTETIIAIADSKIGWASGFKQLISLLYSGLVPRWDLSRIRPAGARLKTFGGRASGPKPLDDLFRFTVKTFKGARGRKLNSIECHDIVCKIADTVVVGGVRRSALISLSNLTDKRMASAKLGQWYLDNPQRSLANNSVCYTEKPDVGIFLDEWKNLYESKCGERGIFNRVAAKRTAELQSRRDYNYDFGTNPCSEILLRPKEFCNLTEVIIRPSDKPSDIRRKIEIATILGTFQSMLTDFRFIGREWKNNCEEERLLGVSLTGIMDNPLMYETTTNLEVLLRELKQHAIDTNKAWSEKLGINQSVAITCVKPSGTVSQLCNTSSGIHPRFDKYYIRRIRMDKKDPLSRVLIDSGIPCMDAPEQPDDIYVFDFPIKTPDGAVTVKDITPVQQLELWKTYALNWCEHKPSISVYYTDDNFLDIGAWIYTNFDIVSGISFMPYSDHIYQAAPYESVTEEQYMRLAGNFPKGVQWDLLSTYEVEDHTTASQELACTGGQCEVT